jgi:hypothetical protein
MSLLGQERSDPADGVGTNIAAVGLSKRPGEDRVRKVAGVFAPQDRLVAKAFTGPARVTAGG